MTIDEFIEEIWSETFIKQASRKSYIKTLKEVAEIAKENGVNINAAVRKKATKEYIEMVLGNSSTESGDGFLVNIRYSLEPETVIINHTDTFTWPEEKNNLAEIFAIKSIYFL